MKFGTKQQSEQSLIAPLPLSDHLKIAVKIHHVSLHFIQWRNDFFNFNCMVEIRQSEEHTHGLNWNFGCIGIFHTGWPPQAAAMSDH